MPKRGILRVRARQLLDSRGKPTVEASVETKQGVFSAAVPSGASTGVHEAVELRDGGKRVCGAGVSKAVWNVNAILAKKVRGVDCADQRQIDAMLLEADGTPDKSRLGANALLAVSLAAARAGAAAENKPLYARLAGLSLRKPLLPVPFLNFINGGKHAGRENDFQEHMIVPLGAKSFSEALWWSAEVFCELRKKVSKKFGYQGALLADEGGFAPPLSLPEERFDLLLEAIEEAGHANNVFLAVDCAASEFFFEGSYLAGRKKRSSGEMIDYYAGLVSAYPLVSIEDGVAEDDWAGWRELTRKLGGRAQLVGDDLLTTNPARIRKAVEEKAANALLLKVNQIGTLSEALDAAQTAFAAGWGVMVSHRSGETEDAFIADLAVGIGAGQTKFGGVARGERTAKYNRLLRIEEELQGKAVFAGAALGKKLVH
ncbi:MAG: phosphopyruvate hydratase [Candidatus Micrarchaeota archaeon]